MWHFTLPLSHSIRWSAFTGNDASIRTEYSTPEYDVTRLALKAFPSNERVLFISDLHWTGENIGIYERMADYINGCHIDWLLFGGDLCSYMDTVAGAMNWLARLNARKGKIAVLGNRESQIRWHSHDYWKQKYQSIGFDLLVNESFETGDFCFYGVDDFRYGTPEWSSMPEDKYCIVLSHNPDAAASYDGKIGQLVLSGHTHGGQFVFPLLGAPYSSSCYGRQFLHGLQQRDDGSLLYTASGIGESGFGCLHRRIGCTRELLFVSR